MSLIHVVVFSLVLKAYITKYERVYLAPVGYYMLSDASCAIFHTGFGSTFTYFRYKSTVTFPVTHQQTQSSIRPLWVKNTGKRMDNSWNFFVNINSPYLFWFLHRSAVDTHNSSRFPISQQRCNYRGLGIARAWSEVCVRDWPYLATGSTLGFGIPRIWEKGHNNMKLTRIQAGNIKINNFVNSPC